MHNDDLPTGTVLSRREILASLGAAGAAALIPGVRLGAAGPPAWLPACLVRPAQTEGPYFVDTKLNRSDIRSDPTDGKVYAGKSLRLEVRVSRLDGAACAPYRGVLVDLWQCDAAGVYSGVKDFQGLFDTTGKQFLRGHQITGADGRVVFDTIYPGWYQGRTVHLHFKIRTDPGANRGTEFTSQLYFDDALSDRVFGEAPYAGKAGSRTRNEGDGIFRGGGRELMLDVTTTADTLAATFDVGLQMG